MSASDTFENALGRILERESRFSADAYSFVREGVSFAISLKEVEGHIGGKHLCEGLRELANRQFGPMAHHVLEAWGVHETIDFGCIVFELSREKMLRVSETDKIEDFQNVYDFESAFLTPYSCTDPVPQTPPVVVAPRRREDDDA